MFSGDSFVLQRLSEAKGTSAVWLDTQRKHLCVRSHRTEKNVLMAKKSSGHVEAETMETRKRVKESKEKTRNLARRGPSREQREVLNGTGSLLSEQSLAKWPSFSENLCRANAVVVED